MANKALNKVKDLYPAANNVKIAKIFVQGLGWFKHDFSLLNDESVEKLKNESVTAVQLEFYTSEGSVRYPDYTIKELQ